MDNIAEGFDLSEKITRAKFEELNMDLFKSVLSSPSAALVFFQPAGACQKRVAACIGWQPSVNSCNRCLSFLRRMRTELCRDARGGGVYEDASAGTFGEYLCVLKCALCHLHGHLPFRVHVAIQKRWTQ